MTTQHPNHFADVGKMVETPPLKGDTVTSSFDYPWAAKTARDALAATDLEVYK